VRGALERGKALSQLSRDELRELAPQLDGTDLADLLREGAPLESKLSAGGTSLERVREQLERARAAVGASRPA
jgi:argininosuccinate lyase